MTETTKKGTISISVNGELHSVETGSSIAKMLAAIGLNPRKVAVERNLEVVPRSTLDHVAVSEGDRFEIVHFVGGG